MSNNLSTLTAKDLIGYEVTVRSLPHPKSFSKGEGFSAATTAAGAVATPFP